ncbi:MAG: folate family ECF transporter S component [Clostridiales bacterium]|jgi:ECF transporter S component (folate family)|nr:folate family ECF transporter S component [Clostridiales bacterium]
MSLQKEVRRLAASSLLIAMGVILGGLLKIPAFVMGTYSVKISFGVLPVILAGVLFGPVYGGIVGGLTDLLQALSFPVGAYMPWFTIVGVFFGLIPGLFFQKGQAVTLPRLFCAVASGQLFGSVVCNTLLITALYNMPLAAILPLRLLNQAVMIPLYTLIVFALFPLVSRYRITRQY